MSILSDLDTPIFAAEGVPGNTDPEGGGDAILILSGGNVDPSLVAEWSK